MTEPQEFSESEKQSPPTKTEKAESTHVDAELQHTKTTIGGALDVIRRKELKLKALAEKREAGELSPHDFDLNYVYLLNTAGLPLTRKDMLHATGDQALVLTHGDFMILGSVDFIHVTEGRMVIDAASLHPDDVLILYPHEVGNEE